MTEKHDGTTISGGNFNAGAMTFGAKSTVNMGKSDNAQKKPVTKVLLAFAGPFDYEWLRLGDEERAIREAWRLGWERDTIEIKSMHAVTGNDLRRALQDEPHIVHLAGHGTPEGVVLTDGKSQSQILSLKAMEALFQDRDDEIRCVVLNQCYSLPLGQLLVHHVPYVIAIEGKLGDKVALEFSRGFYDAISAGKDIASAYNEGRRSVNINCPGMVFSSSLLTREK
jgi:CHAT domain